jgi:signal transduction histidine kinase
MALDEAHLVRTLRQRVAELESVCEEYRVLDETADAVPFRLEPNLGRFAYIGPQAERLLGIAHPRWLELGFLESRLAPAERMSALEQFRLVVEFGAAHEAEFQLRRDDGSMVWLRCSMQMFDSITGATIAGHFLDVTLRRALASEHAQTQKLEAIGRLAAGLAHEINTPIQFINDHFVFIEDGLRDLFQVLEAYRGAVSTLPGEEIARLAAVEQAADIGFLAENIPSALVGAASGLARVATLVRSMKEFSAVDHQGQSARADLNRALQSAIAIAAHRTELVADVETDFGDLPPIACYVGELNQVFLNIILNAAAAVAEVGVGVGSGARGKIRIATAVDGCDVTIAISDTGCGIPAQISSRIFEPFFTTKDVGKGSGQGLSVARTIVESHGGSLTFTSTTDPTTTFLIRLPIA